MKVIQVEAEYPDMANMFIAVDEETNEAAIVDLGCYLANMKRAIGESGADVKYLLMTHGHFDHILGVPHAKKEMDAKSVIHKDDAVCLSDRELNLLNPFGVRADYIPSQPDITVSDGDTVNIGNSVLHVMHTPGHSAGSVCYINYEDRIIFSGDTLFYSTVGRTDTPGACPEKMDESLKKLIDLDGDFTVFTGHGPATTLSHERVRNIYIRRMNRF